MSHNLLNHPPLLQIIQRLPRQTPIDLQSIDQHGDGDEAVGLHVFVEFVRGGLVEDDGVVGLVLDCWTNTSESATTSRVEAESFRDGEGWCCCLGGMVDKTMVHTPLPFDHFFFCFFPAEAAAGACCRIRQQSSHFYRS